MIDSREVGAGAGRHELGGMNGSGGKFLCGELRTFFSPFFGQDLYEGHLWVGENLWPWRSLELSLACW